MQNDMSDNAPSLEKIAPAMDKAPEFDGDDSRSSARTEAPKREAPKAEKAEEPAKSARDQNMEAAVKGARERRQRELEATASATRQRETAPVEPAAKEPPKEMVRVKINGAEKEISKEEYDRAAMRNLAGEDRLDEAKRREEELKREREEIRRELDELRKQVTRPAEAAQQQKDPEPAADPVMEAQRAYDNARLYGTDEEQAAARDALAKAYDERTKTIEDRVAERARNETVEHIQREGVKRATAAEVSDFTRELTDRLPDLVSDPMYRAAATSHITNRVAEAITIYVNEKAPPNVRQSFQTMFDTPAQMMQSFASLAPMELFEKYNEFIAKGHSLPPLGTIKRYAAAEVAMRLNLQPVSATAPADNANTARSQSTGTTAAVDRSDRKAAIENKPGRTNMPRPTGQTRTPPTEAERRRKAFEKVSDRRGKRVGG